MEATLSGHSVELRSASGHTILMAFETAEGRWIVGRFSFPSLAVAREVVEHS